MGQPSLSSKFTPNQLLARDVETRRDFSFYAGDINVTTNDGKPLFVLDDGKGTKEVKTMTAKKVYDEGIQWFEPLANKYMRLKSVAADIGSNPGLKHFTWDQIAKFATTDRPMFSYRSEGPGDWKKSREGADGYFLVTVAGTPYWADAIGQIPFAVNSTIDKLKEYGDPALAIKHTVIDGQKHGEGNVIPGKRVISNHYDDYFVLRGALWAYNRQHGFGPERLADEISRESAIAYGVMKAPTKAPTHDR